MDHRVSKDMISSGMIPSGEKKKEDLGRTQYGSAPSPSSLADAYKSMYDKKEETLNEHHKKDADGNTIPHEGEELNELTLSDKEKEGLNKTVKAAVINASRKVGLNKPEAMRFEPKPKVEEVDKFDIVFNHFISEGYSEKEAYAEMANLTEEQLDEFLKALAQAGMRGAKSVGKATKGIATYAAQQGQQLNKIEKNIPKPQGPVRPTAQKGVEAPKPGSTGFKPSTPSEVVANAAAMRKIRMRKELEPKKGEVMQDEYQHQMKEGIGVAAKTALGLVKNIAKKKVVKDLAGNVATGAAMSAGSNLMSGGGGGQQPKSGTRTTQNQSADLFDIVKGQLLDEGLSEEEIKDIMLTLTPDEILNELSVGKMGDYISAASKDVQKTADSIRNDGSVTGDDPRIKRMTNRAKGMAMAGSKIAKNPIK